MAINYIAHLSPATIADYPTIRPAITKDIDTMVALSRQKRLDYEKAQPQFWRHAPNAETEQSNWFHALLNNKDYILLVAESEKRMIGFVIGRLRHAPEVYQPGGLTLEVDDFCVESPQQWMNVGALLLDALKTAARTKGAVQLLVVCGAHDAAKVRFLKSYQLNVASEWYVGAI